MGRSSDCGSSDRAPRRLGQLPIPHPYCTIVQQCPFNPPALRMDVAAMDHDAYSLPAWIYHDPEFFELETQTIFRQAWQLVCHQSDVPNTGDYHSFEFMGESVIVLRGEDGQIRSFHNACRHRASRLLDESKGHC